LKRIHNDQLNWLTGTFKKHPNSFTDEDNKILWAVLEDTTFYVENYEEYMPKKDLDKKQPVYDPVKFRTGERFRALRLFCKFSLDSLAGLLNVSRVTATKYERDGFRDGLTRGQIDKLVDHFSTILYDSNITPTFADSIRYMIKANDLDESIEVNSWNMDITDKEIEEIKNNNIVTNVSFLETPDEDYTKLKTEVIEGRLKQLINPTNDLAFMLAENISEMQKIHEVLLQRYLGESLYDLYQQPEYIDEGILDTINKILASRGSDLQHFDKSESNRLRLLKGLYQSYLEEYPLTYTQAKTGVEMIDDIELEIEDGK